MNTYILQTITSVRVGEGSAAGAVKLPLTRERHTGWPILPGSSVKGALRARCGWVGAAEADTVSTFGSPAGLTPMTPGALRFGGASLLALPVRSLKNTFALLTCPLALARLARVQPDAPPIPSPSIERALLHPSSADAFTISQQTAGGKGFVVLEELSWIPVADEAVRAWADWLAGWLGHESPLKHLAIVHDDVFTHAATFWTPVRTRAAIGKDGVVEDGKLFTVETLPPETLLWGQVGGERAPHSSTLPNRGESWGIGGHRTTGAGRVAWYWRKDA
jgi:CRISPR-associated protein Cmr4